MSIVEQEKESFKQKINAILADVVGAKIQTDSSTVNDVNTVSVDEISKVSVGSSNVKMMDALEGEGYYVTSELGHVGTTVHTQGHKGIDIGGAPAGTPIKSLGPGTVSKSTYEGSRGYVIDIDHGNGYKTTYQHMQEQSPLKVGDKVSTGDVIGKVGNSGGDYKPHLHLEVHVPASEGTHVDWDGTKTLVDPSTFDYSKIQ